VTAENGGANLPRKGGENTEEFDAVPKCHKFPFLWVLRVPSDF